MTLFIDNPFQEIALVLLITTLAGLVGNFLRQPLIVSFIVVGLFLSPLGLDLSFSREKIKLLSEFGITILLFLVGLKLDLKMVKSLGKVALATGLGQIAFTSIFGVILCMAMGFSPTTSFFISLALTFSSTIIVVKLLADKREIDSLHGRIALGLLVVQDLFVILVMMLMAAIGAETRSPKGAMLIMGPFFPTFLLILAVVFFIKFLGNPLYRLVAKTPELMVTTAVGLAIPMAALTEYIGFGQELGGLLSGMMLASTPLKDSLSGRMAGIRDFLLIFFFINLGQSLQVGSLHEQIGAALVLSGFVLLGNPLIVMLIMKYLGYRKRTGFLTGLTVSQISEFSLIFMIFGMQLGYVSQSEVSIVTLVGAITIAFSTYMMTYSEFLYAKCERSLRIFDPPKRIHAVDERPHSFKKYQIIVIGLGRYGARIAELLSDKGVNVLGVDFDPEVLKKWQSKGIDVCYFDAADPEFAGSIPTAHAQWIIHTIPTHRRNWPDDDERFYILKLLREQGYQGKIAITSHSEREKFSLQDLRPDLILSPFYDAAKEAVELLAAASLGPVERRPEGFNNIV